MTWFRSLASESTALMPATLRQLRYATITASASRMHQIALRHCICVSSVPTRYTESTRIWSLATYFIPCSRFPWCARIRIVVPMRSLPSQFASLRNAPATMEIIPYAIVPSATAIATTRDVVEITLCIEVCSRPGKWILRCRCTWSSQLWVCCAKLSRWISSRARIPQRRPRKMDMPSHPTTFRWRNDRCLAVMVFGCWWVAALPQRTRLSRSWDAFLACSFTGFMSQLIPTIVSHDITRCIYMNNKYSFLFFTP